MKQPKAIRYILRLRIEQGIRIVRSAGWGLILLAGFITIGLWLPLFFQLDEIPSTMYAVAGLVITSSIHWTRRDRFFLERLYPHSAPRRQLVLLEYGSLLLALSLISALIAQGFSAFSLLLGTLVGLTPLPRVLPAGQKREWFSWIPLDVYELRFAWRQHRWLLLGIWLIGALSAFHFAFYLLAILAIVGSIPSWYDHLESLPLLQHRLRRPLTRTLFQHWFILQVIMLPLYLFLFLWQVEFWVLFFIGPVLAGLFQAFSLGLKYARYQPDRVRVQNQVPTMLFFMLCLAPGLILVSVIWTFIEWRRAQKIFGTMSIELKDIVLAYGDKLVLEQVNGSVYMGQITGILGPNGAGKTTLFKTLAGIRPPSQGSLSYRGRAWSAERVAYMPTEPFFYPYMTGGEYLQLLGAAPSMVDQLNAVFELPLDRYAQSYSTGMRKKLAFLGVIALDRPILLLDEPFNGVDLEGNQMMLQLIQAMKAEKVILIASHLLEALMEMADVIYEVRDQTLSPPLLPEGFDQLKTRMQQKNNSAVDQLRSILSKKK